MEKLSVVILTRNEEKNILDCLEGVLGASEIIVVDDNSSDRTLEVVKKSNKKNIKIFKHALGNDFSKQRNYGLSLARNNWVMFLDADERVSGELNQEIMEKIQKKEIKGLRIKRRDVMWNKKLKFGEAGNIAFIRIGRKDSGEWKSAVHEAWNIDGKVENLDNELLHYPHPTVKDFLKEINFYSSLRAERLFKDRTKVSIPQIIFYPKAKFILNYLLRLGFLDGIEGFIFAILMSVHSFLVRAKLWLLYQKEN